MGHVFVVLVGTFVRWFHHHRACALLCLASLLCACSVVGDAPELPLLHVPQDRVREVCWEPSELEADDDTIDTTDTGDTGKYFVFSRDMGPAISSRKRIAFGQEVRAGEFIYKYVASAPIQNLRLIPLSRTDAWCSRIPRPTDEAILKLLDPCAEAALMQDKRSAAKNVLGQTEGVPHRSPLFCDKQPQMAPTTAESISLLNRNLAWQESYDYASNTAKAVTKAHADAEWVNNQDSVSLKRLFMSDPGKLEDIQQKLADKLASIETPPIYDDPILDGIAMAAFRAGFDNGKFEVEAKLFAIDAGIMVLEFVALEIALGPLGGAKLLASAMSKGGRALTAAVSRLENIPIFLPLANGGLGGVVRAGKLFTSVSARMHRYYLEKAMKAPPFNRLRQAGEALHHMVAHGDGRAAKARAKLAKFGIKIDEGWNGVFLPATTKSPNLKGSIVHAKVHSDKYYALVEDFLEQAKSQKDLIRRLKRIRETLENGTFFDVPL